MKPWCRLYQAAAGCFSFTAVAVSRRLEPQSSLLSFLLHVTWCSLLCCLFFFFCSCDKTHLRIMSYCVLSFFFFFFFLEQSSKRGVPSGLKAVFQKGRFDFILTQSDSRVSVVKLGVTHTVSSTYPCNQLVVESSSPQTVFTEWMSL